MKNLGRTTAKLDLALRNFSHPASKHSIAWNTQILNEIAFLIKHIDEPNEKEQVQLTINNFNRIIQPVLSNLRSQVIHNDLAENNCVVDPNNPTTVTGIFDFGDLVYAPLIQNLSITAAEVSMSCQDPFSRSVEIVVGYHEVFPLKDIEFKLLPTFMASRIALSMLIESWGKATQDWIDDRDYMPNWRRKCYAYLKQINELPPQELENRFRAACGVKLAEGDS
ncbi:MAG: phosphotransferase [Flavobacteriales bacterium]|nr:phosphotransferase [Flavobacteriales bacterium]